MVPRIGDNDNNLNNQNLSNNQSNRIISNVNNINNARRNILNYNQTNLNMVAERSNNIFILLFNPNKCFCFFILILNILISGLGTIIIGLKNCSLYDFILGIIQFCGCYFLFLLEINIKKFKYIFYIRINSFMHIYLIVIAIIFYLSSIYTGIFHNFIFFNPRRAKVNEKGICILILNLITGGIGTLLYGFIINNEECLYRIKMWGVGIIQICGFIIFIFAFSCILRINTILLIILFLIGGIGYLTSILVGIKCYKKILIS